MTGKEIIMVVEKSTDPPRNLEREDRLFDRVDSGELPELIRFWVNSECLIRGRVRHPGYGWYDERRASEFDVPVYERSTGGGVVYNDLGNLNWSVFMKTSGGFLSPAKGFENASRPVITALQELGLGARFAAPNRIDVDGRKVSGMAARSRKHTMLVHGTLLINTNLKRLNDLCLPPAGCPPVVNLSDLKASINQEFVISTTEKALRDARRVTTTTIL